jgi:hypothetical protein
MLVALNGTLISTSDLAGMPHPNSWQIRHSGYLTRITVATIQKF